MPQSLSQIYLHIIFSTKNRYPFINQNVEMELYAYIGGIIKKYRALPIMISGMPDHVHIFTTFPRSITVSNFIKEIKTGSSHWIKSKGHLFHEFAWQEGYGVFSISSSQTDTVSSYIANQKQHHQKRTFKEELILFLKKYNMDYDDRYLWD